MTDKKRNLENGVEQSEKKSKFNNKRSLLTDAGAILKPEHIKQIKSMGLLPPGGEKFDSELEAVYYRDVLLPRVLAGEIEVQRQLRFRIIPGYTKYGATFRDRYYVPDFLLKYPDGRMEAIDVKGYADPVFLMKRMLFDGAYPDIPLFVVKRVLKYGGWITTEEYAENKKRERKESRSLATRSTRPRQKARKRS